MAAFSVNVRNCHISAFHAGAQRKRESQVRTLKRTYGFVGDKNDVLSESYDAILLVHYGTLKYSPGPLHFNAS